MKSPAINLFTIFLLILLTGCGGKSILNVKDHSVIDTSEKQLKQAILRAGTRLGWKMQATGKGKILGTIHVRTHMAQVDIAYTNKSYDITYKDSDNLNYEGDTIHRSYNNWVINLQRHIDSEIINN